jgi:hypothetical protein
MEEAVKVTLGIMLAIPVFVVVMATSFALAVRLFVRIVGEGW